MSHRKVVLVAPVDPGPTGHGLRMRAGALLRSLRSLGDTEVVIVPVHGPEPSTSGVVVDLDRCADERQDFRRRLADPRLRASAMALRPLPDLCRFATVAVAERCEQLVAGADAVVVMRLYLAPVVDTLFSAPARPRMILDVDDVESDTHRGRGELDQAARFGRLEDHYLPRFDAVLACSDGDADALRARHGVEVTVVPNVMPPVSGSQSSRGVGRQGLLFVANLSYAPNVEAAVWLCDEVAPRLGGTRISLVGHNPTATVRALGGRPEVTVTGTVAAVSQHYAQAAVAVVPLRRGGGTSIKVLEAMAHSLPIVATTVGARGIPLIDGVHGYIADDPAEFARRCSLLLGDAARAAAMGRAGHELGAASFNDQVATRALGRALGNDHDAA